MAVDERSIEEGLALERRLEDDLADFKRPRWSRFVDEIPLNPSGKIMRYKLQERED